LADHILYQLFKFYPQILYKKYLFSKTQVLLGRESSKTTEIYIPITKKGWDKLRSPVDNLDIGGTFFCKNDGNIIFFK